MSDIEDTVSKEEEIVYKGRPSWLYYFCLYILGIILFSILSESGDIRGGTIALLATLSIAAILRYRYYFTVSNDRVIMRVGLIARNTNEMKLRHIRSMNVRQNAIERILGIGTTIFISAADGEAAVVFRGIRDPHRVKERIRSVQEVV